MKPFKAYLTETLDHGMFHFSSHPKEWVDGVLAKKAEERYGENKGFGGSVTAMTRSPVRLPLSMIGKFPGRNNEDPKPGGYKYDRLMSSVKEQGGLNTKDNPISINVNHRGEAALSEGNNRMAVAKDLGHTHVWADVAYYNGAEHHTTSQLPADQLKHLHTPE